MITMRITLDTSEWTKQLTALEQKQLPFARSLAINRLGEAFQKAERERLGSIFTLRRKDFIEKQGVKRLSGIATKNDPTVTYGMDRKADFLAKFERDTRKLPTKGSGHVLAIPAGGVRRNKQDIVTAGNRPRALIQRFGGLKGARQVVVIDKATGKIGPGIYQRTGRKGKGSLKALFVFKPSVSIDPELHFVDTAKRVAAEQWPAIFAKALQDALSSAR
jgi:hypothetical protein